MADVYAIFTVRATITRRTLALDTSERELACPLVCARHFAATGFCLRARVAGESCQTVAIVVAKRVNAAVDIAQLASAVALACRHAFIDILLTPGAAVTSWTGALQDIVA